MVIKDKRKAENVLLINLKKTCRKWLKLADNKTKERQNIFD